MILRHSILAGLMILLLALPGFDTTAAPNDPPKSPDRYLLVVDTSSPMRARADALEASVAGLVGSGMQGGIRNGDQLGIWTFNNELHTGDFDLVIWDEASREEILGNVLKFLDQQRYRKSTDFTQVMPDLMEVVAGSRRITVILFSDGDEAISGTPFDEAITAYFRENADAIKDMRAPILTVMRGYKGELIGHTMSYPPWPVEFPEFPAEPEPAPAPAPRPESPGMNVGSTQPDLSRTLLTTDKGPIVFAEPLIVRGPSRDKGLPTTPTGVTNEAAAAVGPTSAAPSQATQAPSTDEVDTGPPAVAEAEAEASSSPNPEERFRSWMLVIILLVGGGILLVVALVAGFLLMRRPRTRRRASLITRSMHKKRGPE